MEHLDEKSDDRKRQLSEDNVAGKLFFEMGQRCENCGALSSAADCFKTATSVFHKIANETEAKAAKEKYNKIVEQLKQAQRIRSNWLTTNDWC